MKKSKFTLEVEKKLIRQAPKKFRSGFKPEDFLKGNGLETSRLHFLNNSVPTIRQQLATLKTTKAESLHPDLFADMHKLWFESDIFDSKSIAVHWLEHQKPEFLVKNHKKILSWAGEIDNWAHSDALCSSYARLFEAAPDLVLPIYLRWNSHKNPWLRRCSMVGTFFYSRARKNQPSMSLAKKLVTPHLQAKEYYVQKGVGWTIREMYNVYPVETIDYINNNIHLISSIAWVAASEKLPAKIKHPLLKKRKAHRQNVKENSKAK